MRIVHVLSSIESEAAGPSVSVPRLAEAQARWGAEVSIATIGAPSMRIADRTTVPHTLFPQSAENLPLISKFRLSKPLREWLSQCPADFDVIHSHGLWLAPNVYPALAARNGALWVVSPRGMLSQAALTFSAYKKKVFWKLLQEPAIRHAGLMHATSEEEAENIRKAGVEAPIVIVPNGVVLPGLKPEHRPNGKRILSLGRVHPKKGLDRLVDAWASIAERYPDWCVEIVGPDEGGYAHDLRQRIRRLGVPRIEVSGPLFGGDKLEAYHASSMFVLPSLNENFAMTVAEALAAELPVISTKGAPWHGLEIHGCGRWIDHGAEPLAAAISELIDCGDDARVVMGRRGRAWVERDFSWDSVGKEILSAYSAHLR